MPAIETAASNEPSTTVADRLIATADVEAPRVADAAISPAVCIGPNPFPGTRLVVSTFQIGHPNRFGSTCGVGLHALHGDDFGAVKMCSRSRSRSWRGDAQALRRFCV